MSFTVPPEAYSRFMGRYAEPLATVFAAFAGVDAKAKVLDVGCGPGAMTAHLLSIGADLAAALAQSASEAVAKLGALVGLDSLMAGILRRLRCSVSGLQGIPCVTTSLHHS